jgi:hypothetical protein
VIVPLAPIKRHLSIHYVRHVVSLAEESHDFLAGACHLQPTGFGVPFEANLSFSNYNLFESQAEMTKCRQFQIFPSGFPSFLRGLDFHRPLRKSR